jgi:hypothetical protein
MTLAATKRSSLQCTCGKTETALFGAVTGEQCSSRSNRGYLGGSPRLEEACFLYFSVTSNNQSIQVNEDARDPTPIIPMRP